jgi:hypothetical protein
MLFLISVIDDRANSGTPEEMVKIDVFNDMLRAKDYWVFAGGIDAPSTAMLIDNRSDAGSLIDQPLFGAAENFSGFWIVDVQNREQAVELALEGSKACNRKVELRPFL